MKLLVPAVAAALLAALAFVAHAAGFTFFSALYTGNNYSDKYVWVTIYDLGKTRHLDYGCMKPGETRTWGAGSSKYASGSYYYIRGEVMTDKECKGTKICDTTVQARVANKELEARGSGYSGVRWSIFRNKTDPNNCYWDQR